MDKKIIILSRVSTGTQHLEAQTAELVSEAVRLGYTPENHIIIESFESAIKLKESEREGLEKMKHHIELRDDVDCVICWEPSRLSRRQETLFSIRDYLIEHKIQLYIKNPALKLFNDDRTRIDPNANTVFSLFATLAENEMMIKKERFMRAKNELTQQGKKAAGSVIFGYMKDKTKHCVPHPLHAKIVVELFTHYVTHDDTSLYETYLYAAKNWAELFPILEYKKAQHRIRHIFDTAVYVDGNWCYPALISKELWDKTKKKMSEAVCKPRYGSKLQLLGRGKVICNKCGNIMTACGGNVRAYCCSTDKLHSLQMNIEALEWLIWEEVRVAVNIYSSISNTERILEINNQIKERKTYKEQLQQKIDELTEKQDKLVSLYLDNKINETIYNKRYDDFNHETKYNSVELNKVNNQINELEAALKESDDNFGNNAIVVDNITDFNIRLEYTRKLLDKVILTRQEDSSILIEFTWLQNLIIPHSKYIYTSRGGRKKIYRINEDETRDLIYQ